MLERFFQLAENKTTWQRETLGGLTTFATMAYIIFVQPAILGAAGMDWQAVMVATCLASAIGCFAMGLMANYPIALAPAMGHNVYFTYTVVLTLGYPWQQALAAVFVSGVLFILLSLVGLRESLITLLPASLKDAIAVGIGLLICIVGLEWSGIVVEAPGTLIGLGDLSSTPVLISLLGLTVMAILLVLGIQSALLIGMGVALAAALVTGIVHYQGFLASIPSLSPTFFKLELGGVLQTGMLSIIFIFFFLDLFDTVGTLTGVTRQAGILRPDGSLPRARPAFLADALATTSGALLGTSTVTSYIESASGVTAGARTGLASLVTGVLFLSALFFSPLVSMIGGAVQPAEGLPLYPIVAPALILVGLFLIKNVSTIPWDDYTEAVPAFLTIVIMPFTFSITEGIAFGFIFYTILKCVQGRFHEVPGLISLFAILFVFRYIFL